MFILDILSVILVLVALITMSFGYMVLGTGLLIFTGVMVVLCSIIHYNRVNG